MGTNSVAMSMKLNKSVYSIPRHHYCSFLNKTYLFCKPMLIHENTTVYLVLASENKPITNALFAMTELLGSHICSIYRQNKKENEICKNQKIRLSQKQLSVLLHMAEGKPDKVIALEMNRCIDTIKYHKQNIFSKLNASCTIEAVIKAFKENIITLDQIDV